MAKPPREGKQQDLVRQSWDRAQSATDPAEARRWLQRAHRLLPADGLVATSLASALLAQGEADRAAKLFQAVAERHGTPESWAGLAAAAHTLNRGTEARGALIRLLHGSVVTSTVVGLATAIAGHDWCGLTLEGTLWAGPGRATTVRIDGNAVRLRWTSRRARLPPGWDTASSITVENEGQALLGSPLPVPAIIALEGVVEAFHGGVNGWAWYPADPRQSPKLVVSGPHGTLTIVAAKIAEVPHERPLAQRRRFSVPAAAVADLGTPLSVRGPDRRHLLGSPLDPGIEARAVADPAHAGFAPVWADVIGPPARGPSRQAPIAVVVPVFRGRAETLGCLASILAGTARGTRVIVVDDASPDAALVDTLAAMAHRCRITLVRLPENLGFPAAANAGIAAAQGRDVVLLNSDTLVPPGWLHRLRAAAYAAPDIGTVSPLSNDATILSYPDRNGGNPIPNLAATQVLDRLAQQANGTATPDIPVGVGFCLYIRRACLDAVGNLREDLFAQGYGEENDFCLRARHAGWRNVAAPGVFVAHLGAASFGAARQHLVRRNTAILNRLHPGYDALIAHHLAYDPLAPARQRMDTLRWEAGRQPAGAVVSITHAAGGGVERVVQDRAAAVVAGGQRAILLRPVDGASVRVEEPGSSFPNLIFPVPEGLPALVRLLKPDKPVRVELHHMLGHAHELAGLAQRLGIAAVSIIHDYARFCPRIALVGAGRHYCGEPDVPGCEACIADLGSLLDDDPPIRTLLARSAAELRAATRVVAPSADAATRIARHFPGVRPTVEHWEHHGAIRRAASPAAQILRIVVVGAIGLEKGFEVLLASVRDARSRSLPMTFIVVGFTVDDERLMAAGPAFVTGKYAEADAVALIQAQEGHIALIPSVWPETWCFALSRAWEAGLPAAVFDLGAQAERVRANGGGTVLPLGLGAGAVNDALLRLATPGPSSHCPAV